MEKLVTTPAPNLPQPTPQYSAAYQGALLNVLRLFFNLIADTLRGLTGTRGGQYINNAYGAFQNNADVVLTAANTAEAIPLPVEDFVNGMAVGGGGGGIQVSVSGLYNLQFSLQFANTDTAIHAAVVWLRKNSTDVPGTASKFDVPSKHGASDGYLIGACNFYVDLLAGESVELWWAAGSTAVYIEAYPAQTTPFARPTIPSAVATLTFVSSI